MLPGDELDFNSGLSDPKEHAFIYFPEHLLFVIQCTEKKCYF